MPRPTIKVAINGYGVIGKRCADAVAKQDDMKLVGVSDISADWRVRMGARKGLPIYCSMPEKLEDMKKAEKTRGEILLDHYKKFFEICKNPDVKEKPDIITKERAAHRWGRSMMSFIKAVSLDENSWLITNVRNNGAVRGMDPEAIMEIPTIVNRTGAHPIAIGDIPLQIRGLIHAMYAFSVLTAKAAMEGSYDLALTALMANPLVPTYNIAKKVLDEILRKYKKYLSHFYR